MTASVDFQRLFAYHQALNQKLWDSIALLNEGQFLQELDYSHGSIRNQLIHMAVTERRWLYGLQADPQARSYRLDPAGFPDMHSVRKLWDEVSMELTAYLQDLDEELLALVPAGFYGSVWQALLHLINHGTDHLAQVLRALKDFGVPTFDQDLILYLWRHKT